MPDGTQKEPSTPPLVAASPVVAASESSGDLSDVLAALTAALLAVGGLLWFAFSYRSGEFAASFVLIGLLGGSGGWLVGILISPYTSREATSFSSAAKVAYGFLTGYLFSRLDPVINGYLTSGALKSIDAAVLAHVGVLLVTFFVAIAATYISRAYWTGAS